MSSAQTNRPLNECPTNVKEALEWLAALDGGSGATHCAQVITQQILGSTNGYTNGLNGGVCQTLCTAAAAFMSAIKQNGGASYTSTSTYQGAQWNYLCQNTGGSTKCCQLTSGYGTGCRECTGGAQCHGCCPQCPQQICARIFCLIVPVVYSALWYLQFMVRQNGHYSNNRDSIQAYLGALGFNNQGEYNTQKITEQVRQALQQQQPPQGSLLGALGTATLQIKNALQRSTNIFVDGQSNGSTVYYSSGNNLTTPTSAKDLMLWTIFLPYCCNYNVHGRLSNSLLAQNEGEPSRAPGGGSSPLSPLEGLISGLHVLFIGMEAGGQGLSSHTQSSSQPPQPPRTLFDGIFLISHGMAPYEYYTNRSSVSSSSYVGTEQCCKLLVAGIPIISSAVEMLHGQYGGGGGGSYNPNGNSLEQHLGFGNGMQQLSSTLGPAFFGYVHSMMQQVKTAYCSDKFDGYSSSHSGSVPSTGSTTPRTFREMLLWLQGLPCSEGYHEVRGLLTNGSSRSIPKISNGQTSDPLVEIIFNLPYLFYHLEPDSTSGHGASAPNSNGTMTRYITDLFESEGIQVRSGAPSPRASTPSTIDGSWYNPQTIQKTFCAIVAVVYYVVDHLKRKYNGAGGYNGITTDSGLLEFLGWQDNTQGVSAFNNGSILNSVLQYCLNTVFGAAHSRGGNGNYLKGLFQQLRDKLSSATTSALSTHSTPTTFRETLLWLVGAPLTQDYESVKNTVQSRTSSSSTDIENNITDTIVGVLQLFHKLEGNILSAVLGVFTAEQNGTIRLTYDYGSSSTNNNLGHSIFGAAVVMRSVFGFLQQRCNTMVGLVGVGDSSNDSWKDCTVTCGNGGPAVSTTECQNDNNPLCKFLCLLGWNHTKRMGGAGTAAAKTKDTLNGTAFHTHLVSWFGSLDTTGQASLSSSYTYVQSSALSLKALYDCAVQWFQKKTEESEGKGTEASATTTPTTIRDMMLWLIGLPLHSVYTKLTDSKGSSGGNGVIKTKFDSLRSINNATTGTYSTSAGLSNSSQITNAIVSSSQGMIITMLAIEGNIKSVWDFLARGLKTDSNTFTYGSSSGSGSDAKDSKSGSKDSNGEACFSLLVDYTYKVHFQLRFLLVMCDTGKAEGGWKDCEYRGSGSGSLSSSSDAGSLTCTCNGSSGGCPMPLYYFLNGVGTNKFKNNLNGNGTGGSEKNGNGNDVTMGFFNGTYITTLSTTSNGKLTGADIYALLKYYVDTATENKTNTFSASTQPFSLLAQCIVAIGQRKPSTLGDCFELVWQLGYGLLRSYVEKELKEELKNITLEVNGDNKTAADKLITAIQNLFSTQHTDSSSSNHDKSLGSLMCTNNTNNNGGGSSNGCTPYMKSLSQGVYQYYCPEITGADPEKNQFTFLQYLYDMLKKLLDKMKELQKEFNECDCCKTEKSTCTDLISCPNAHPILYKFGFVFGEPSKLNGNSGTSKKCRDIKAQLDAVLSCTQGSESALFSAFECVIQVTYKVLLERARGIIDGKYDTKNGNGKTTTEGLKSTNTEMNTAFTLYVHNAMYQSYPKLICTFACKVFDGNHECSEQCKKRFTAPGGEPNPPITASPSSITVFSSPVTTITAVIPQYTAPVIDRYHYRTFQKKSDTEADGNSSNHYSFRDAIDFHLRGANCIRPTPVALRSVIDWILRVTTGAIATQEGNENGDKNNNSNGNIKEVSGAIKKVFQECGVSVTTDTEVQPYVVSLVQGLRKFVGYQDRSQSVKTSVTTVLGKDDNNGNGVKGALKEKIDAIEKFIGENGKANFGTELGKALLKGRYECKHSLFSEVMRTISAVVGVVTGYKKDAEPKAFKEVVELFTSILKAEHKNCDQKAINCKTLKLHVYAKNIVTHNLPYGLSQLHDFFQQIQYFAKEWDSIGKKNGGSQPNTASSSVVHNEKDKAIKAQWTFNGSSPQTNGDYFTKLYEALHALGQCAEKVEKLNNSNGSENSKEYRTKISALITGLKAFVTHIAGCDFNGSQDSNNKSDPVYAVNGAQRLMEKTKRGVEKEITMYIKTEISNAYGLFGGKLGLASLLCKVESKVCHTACVFRCHLDDLKQLCQWLYRMGQLYAHGLKGFVESLITHLEHIIQVIKWIEKLKLYMTIVFNSNNAQAAEVQQSITAGASTIAKLLSSYVLRDADSSVQIQDDNASEYRTFLYDLRLLALDRYTLQVWQDECSSKECKIKDWITFENGIVRHSDLNAIKQQLSALTGIAYNSTTAPVASTTAPPSASRSRIHNFHAICVIQKFSYQEPIARLGRSLEKLKEIQGQLSAVKEKCNENKQDVSSDEDVQKFSDSVSQFLSEPYGIYNFAKFVHTIMGPNIFSAVIGAFEELTTEKLNGLSNNDNKNRFSGIVKVMTEGLQSDKDNKDHYKLGTICEKLGAFITTLRKEYIFAYPVVTATAAQAIAPQPKNPTCPNTDHSKASICHHCYPYLAKIFIGAIPNLYRHCRLLYEMCDIEPGYSQKGILSMTAEDYYNRFMLSLSVFMSHQGYEVLTRGKDGTINPSAFKYELDPMLPVGYVFQKLKDIISGSDPLDETKTDSLMPLDQLFKAVMQHFKDERNKKRKQREEKLKQEFDKNPNNRGLPFQAPPPVLPSTVRQVLFWLHELDTQGEFYKQLCDHIFTLCKQSSIQIYDGVITHLLKLSATQCLEVLATIEDPGRQNADYYYELYTEEHYYAYPTVNIPLFFYTFVEKLMAAFLELNFVCVQCEFLGSQGGWHGCRFYSDDKVFSRDPKGTHCTCSALESTCPRPLSAFLFSDQKNQLRIPSDVSQRLAYMSKGTMPCGFKLKNKAITDAATPSPAHTPTSTSVSGSVLVEPLRKLVGGHVTGRLNDTSTRIDENNTLSTVIYLRDLLRYTLCLAVRPPWSMSENMAFFYRLTESWKKDQVYTGVRVALRNDNLLGAIHAEIDMFPGSFEGKKLTLAVERFAGVADKEHQKTNGTVSNTSHQFDLKTLMGCQETNTATSSGTTPVLCSPFMFPLSLDVYTHYDERNSRAYLSWILNFAFGIYGQLRGLQERMEQQTCVTSNASQSTSSSCPSLPMCPGVLTALYQSGSSFMDQGQLAKNTNAVSATTTKKTCDDFHSVLTGLFNCEPSSCSPLHNLIVQCEAFLWSIRLPFSLVQLSLWSVAILFISYVFVVPLDHFKIKSHLFNRLKYTMHPSLLIADQQRRVSEVAYFSL